MIEREKVTLPVVVAYHNNDGVRRGILVDIGNKWSRVIMMDYPLQVSKVYNRELNYMNETGYPLNQAVKHFRRVAKIWHGATGDLPKNVKLVLSGL